MQYGTWEEGSTIVQRGEKISDDECAFVTKIEQKSSTSYGWNGKWEMEDDGRVQNSFDDWIEVRLQSFGYKRWIDFVATRGRKASAIMFVLASCFSWGLATSSLFVALGRSWSLLLRKWIGGVVSFGRPGTTLLRVVTWTGGWCAINNWRMKGTLLWRGYKAAGWWMYGRWKHNVPKSLDKSLWLFILCYTSFFLFLVSLNLKPLHQAECWVQFTKD